MACRKGGEGQQPTAAKSHPKAAGMNNTPLEYWEELREIFGASRAIGSDAVQLGDAAKVMENNTVIDDLMEEDSTGFEEMEKFSELTRIQKMKAMRFFTKDEGEAATFFQLQTDEEKLEFILNFVV
ncbi:hypothetical protein LINPERHAP1_LOCUS1438 [Linum perenne]